MSGTKDEELFGPAEVAEVEPAAPEPEAPQPEAEAPETPAPEQPEADDEDGDLPAGSISPATVAAMRRDWKAKAIRQEEQLKAAQAELERLKAEAAKPPAPAAPQAQRTAIDPNADPATIVRNAQLDTFEEMVREKHGAKVDQALAAFEAEAARNPVLDGAIRSARNPWAAMVQWYDKHQVMTEIGDDPRSWQERERERIRAEVAAEMAQQQPPARPAAPVVPRGAPSLAGATAAAPRGAPVWTGETPMADILPNNRAFGG